MREKSGSPHQKWAGEVERLLRQLRPRKPTPPPPAASAPATPPRPRPAASPAAARAAPLRAAPARPTPLAATASPRPLRSARPLTAATPPRVATLPSPYGVWARVILAGVLFVAMTQWPYRVCGFPLAAYLLGVVVALVAGVWAAHAAWRRRMGRAHVIALVLLLGGIALGALQVLPRLGYAPVATTWGCTL